ncbi:MAG: OmpH family outer membrane protein [Verrucomicrobiae bacterium]|nr:OmpH family outer membrane protein [Verrucomicrobiae bacterium]
MGRIVTVDLNRVFNEFYKTPIASAKLKETADSYNKEHEQMLAEYRRQVDDLNKLREEQDKPEYSEEMREQKRRALQEKLAETQKTQREIEEFRRTHQKLLEDQTQRMRQNILKEITEAIRKEALDAGYAMVLDKSGNTLNGVPSVVFALDSVDIPEDILKILNRNQPKPTETPKPTTTAPPTFAPRLTEPSKPAEKN